MGLAGSTILVRSSDPTTLDEVAGRLTLTPYVKLLVIAKSALLLDGRKTPTALMDCRRCIAASSAIPMRVSAVWDHVSIFGVSSDCRYGMAFRHSGIPSTAD